MNKPMHKEVTQELAVTAVTTFMGSTNDISFQLPSKPKHGETGTLVYLLKPFCSSKTMQSLRSPNQDYELGPERVRECNVATVRTGSCTRWALAWSRRCNEGMWHHNQIFRNNLNRWRKRCNFPESRWWISGYLTLEGRGNSKMKALQHWNPVL